MASIGFFVLPNKSCLNASLKLAADLKDRGHTIHYVGLEDSAEYIASNGFNFVPVFTTHFPKGFHESVASMETPQPWRETYFLARKFVRNYEAFVDSLIDGHDITFQNALREFHLELMIYVSDDYFIDWPALLAYAAGVPGVYLSYMCSPRERSAAPPVNSSLIPSDSYWSRLRVYIEWKKQKLWYPLSIMRRLLGADLDIGALTRKLAVSCGYKHKLLSDPFRKPTLMRLPEIISFPPGFNFFDEKIPGQHFFGPCVYLQRQQPSFSWEQLDIHRPLLYCALGTVPFLDKVGYKNSMWGTFRCIELQS